MPNWAKGTLKVRGAKKNVKRFVLQTFDDVIFDNWGAEVFVNHSKNHTDVWMNQTRRAFVDFSDEIFGYPNENGDIILEFPFMQAWAAIPENYSEISKKYDVDIKIFTFEQGQEFTQEVEIIKGKITKDSCYQYDDYKLEVSFSNLGG